jgi:hypothetical protein
MVKNILNWQKKNMIGQQAFEQTEQDLGCVC